MAILWELHRDGVHYQVRGAGRTRRLYTAGIFHSQFNPAQPVSGSVWDLLFLPAFFGAVEGVCRVLVLGLGGGAVVRQLQHFVRPRAIVAVELNPVHLQVAQRFFGIDPEVVTLVRADAHSWVRGYGGAGFDLIVDDLFAGEDGEPVRAVTANAKWFDRLVRLLAPRGTLVMNFPASADLRTSGYCSSPSVARHFAAAYRFTHPLHHNVVAAFLRAPSSPATLRANLEAVPALDLRRKGCRLRFAVRRI